jgi:hypothetical protein
MGRYINKTSKVIWHKDVTPVNTTTQYYDSLFVGTAGNVACVPQASLTTTAVYKNIANGTWFPVNVAKVLATSTTATDIIGLKLGREGV